MIAEHTAPKSEPLMGAYPSGPEYHIYLVIIFLALCWTGILLFLFL